MRLSANRLIHLALSALVLMASATAAPAAVLVVDCVAGPYPTIGAAVAAAFAGDTIVVHGCSTGPYNENVILAGAAYDRVRLVGASFDIEDYGALACGLPEPAAVIDGSGLAGSCITVQGTTSVSIVGFEFQNCAPHAVHLIDDLDTVVKANRIVRTPGIGIRALQSFNAQILCNLVGLSDAEGILLLDTEASLVGGNLVGRSGAAGIMLQSANPDRGSINNEVCGNDLRNNAGAGVVIGCETEDQVERNSFAANGGMANLWIQACAVATDAVGNDTGGSLQNDSGSSSLSDNS